MGRLWKGLFSLLWTEPRNAKSCTQTMQKVFSLKHTETDKYLRNFQWHKGHVWETKQTKQFVPQIPQALFDIVYHFLRAQGTSKPSGTPCWRQRLRGRAPWRQFTKHRRTKELDHIRTGGKCTGGRYSWHGAWTHFNMWKSGVSGHVVVQVVFE